MYTSVSFRLLRRVTHLKATPSLDDTWYTPEPKSLRCVVMAAKRPAGDAGGAPPPKKVALGPIDIGPSSGEEDLNIKILQVTHTAGGGCQIVPLTAVKLLCCEH